MRKNKDSFKRLFTKVYLAFSVALIIFSLIFVKNASAAVGINREINFQGKLVDNPSATNVTNGTYTVVFTLYDAPTGGTALWTETQTVTTTDGIFRVALGSVNPFPANFNFNWSGLYLGIKVNSDLEMTPRIQMAAVPFAFNAQAVAGLTVEDENGNASTSGTLQVANGKTVTFGNAFNSGTNGLTFSTSGTTTLSFGGSGSLTVVDTSNSQTLTNKIIGNGGLTFDNTSKPDITTTSNQNFNLSPNGTGLIGFNTNSPLTSSIDLRGNPAAGGTLSIASVSGSTSFAALVANNDGTGDLFTASASGWTRFVIKNNGSVGIGVANPNNLIQVAGLINFNNNRDLTALGYQTGINNTIGGDNSFVGYQAGLNSSTGDDNSFFGSLTGKANTNGSDNSFVGYASGANSTTGYNNSFLGSQAGLGNTGGTNNTFLGYLAGQTNSGGGLNTILGSGADLQSPNLINAGAIGAYAYVSQSNSLVLGSINGVNAATGSANIGIGVTAPNNVLQVQGGYGANALFSLNQLNNADLFTASYSGATVFTLTNAGGIALGPSLNTGASTQCLLGGATASWGDCGANWWNEFAGAVSPVNTGDDLLLGGNSTSSALVSFINLSPSSGGNPTLNLWDSASHNNALQIYATATGANITTNNAGVINIGQGGGTLFVNTTIVNDSNTSPAGANGAVKIGDKLLVQNTENGVALGVFDNTGTGDIITASSSGAPVFTITSSGGIALGANRDLGLGLCLTGGPTASWGSCGTGGGGGNSPFTELPTGLIVPNNTTTDFILGSQATSSATFRVTGNLLGAGTRPLVTVNGNTSNATLIVNNLGVGDLLAASASGVPAFTVQKSGNIIATGSLTGLTGLALTSGSITLNGSIGSGQCLIGGPTASWGSCSGTVGGGVNWWNELGGALSPVNLTDDLLIGSTSTSSALFSFTGVKTGQTIASVSGQLVLAPDNGYGGNLKFLGTNPSIFNTGSNTLTINSGSTGNIQFFNNNNTFSSTGNLSLSGTTGVTLSGNGANINFSGTSGNANSITTANNNNLSIAAGTGTITLGSLTSGGNIQFFGGSNTLSNTGTLTLAGNLVLSNPSATAQLGGITYAWPASFAAGYVLSVSGTGTSGTLSWVPSTNLGWWNELSGALSPKHATDDLLIGGNSTSSALFSFSGIKTGQTIASVSGSLIVMPNYGYGMVGINTISPITTLDVRGTSGTQTVGSFSGNTSKAVLGINNLGSGDLIAASSSGIPAFTVSKIGTIGFGTDNVSGNTAQLTSDIVSGTTGEADLKILNSGVMTYWANFGWNAGVPDLYFYGTTAQISANGVNIVEADSTGNTIVRQAGASGSFEVKNSSDTTTYFTVDSTGKVTIGNSTNGLSFDPANGGPTYSGTGMPSKVITLSPEYAGAVLTQFYGAGTDTSSTGSMTSDAETSATNNLRTYYLWTSSTVSPLQYYTVAVRITLPSDFGGWDQSQTYPFTIDYVTSNGVNTNNSFNAYIYNATNSTTAVTSSTGNVSTSWTSLGFTYANLTGGTATWGAGGTPQTAVIYLRMGALNNNTVKIGDIKLYYKSKF